MRDPVPSSGPPVQAALVRPPIGGSLLGHRERAEHPTLEVTRDVANEEVRARGQIDGPHLRARRIDVVAVTEQVDASALFLDVSVRVGWVLVRSERTLEDEQLVRYGAKVRDRECGLSGLQGVRSDDL